MWGKNAIGLYTIACVSHWYGREGWGWGRGEILEGTSMGTFYFVCGSRKKVVISVCGNGCVYMPLTS